MVHQSLSGQAPAYLTDNMLNVVADNDRRLLRSAVDRTCVVPLTHNTYGDKSFTVAARSACVEQSATELTTRH